MMHTRSVSRRTSSLPFALAPALCLGLCTGAAGLGCGDDKAATPDGGSDAAVETGGGDSAGDPRGDLAPGSGSVSYQIGTDSYTMSLAHAAFTPGSPGLTRIEGSNADGEFMLSFAPMAPGAYACGAAPYVFLHVGVSKSGMLSTYHAGTCTVTVTGYGAAGGAIDLTFAAHLMKAGGPGPDAIDITGGTVNALRGDDG